jgi:hypothetical protein
VADRRSVFEPSISPLQIDPARALLPEGQSGPGLLAAEAATAAKEYWQETPSWIERAEAIERIADSAEKQRAKIDFATELLGGFQGRLAPVKGTKALTPRPQLAERYPAVGEPVLTEKLPGGKPGRGKPGKPITGVTPEEAEALVEKGQAFWAKGETEEAQAVGKMRKAAQQDIDAGNYKPYFDVAQRRDVDPTKYPGYVSTEGQMPKKPKAIKKYTEHAEHPEATKRLEDAYLKGASMPNSDKWYFMRQLEDVFIKHLGPIEGRKQFDNRFASPMAATTGGSSPTGNLMTAIWANWVTGKGGALPQTGYQRAAQIPFPVGGQFMKGNIAEYNKMLERGIEPETPKRWNFRWNFLGQKGPTIDEQISNLFDPNMKVPEFYGPYQRALSNLAAKHGVDPREFQEVAWAGHKALTNPKGYKVSKPMIQIVNEAIERTSRITGVPPEEVVKRALVYGTMPLYGTVGVVAADKISGQIVQRYQQPEEGM